MARKWHGTEQYVIEWRTKDESGVRFRWGRWDAEMCRDELRRLHPEAEVTMRLDEGRA